MMAIDGHISLLRLAPELKFGASLTASVNEQMIIIPPSEYFVTVSGYESKDENNIYGLPISILNILSSWNIDTTKNHPQFLDNPCFLLHQNDGTRFNAFTLVLHKSSGHNNIRILLHKGSSPTPAEDHLFFIDVDEDNMYARVTQDIRQQHQDGQEHQHRLLRGETRPAGDHRVLHKSVVHPRHRAC